MRDVLYRIWLSIRLWCQRRVSLQAYEIRARIVDPKSGRVAYNYYMVWAKSPIRAKRKLEVNLKRLYKPYVEIECRIKS